MTAVGIPTTGAGPAARTTSNRWIALTGVLFALLLGAAVVMTSGEPAAKNATKVQAWVVKHSSLIGGSFVITTAAVIVGLLFLVWLHSHLGRDGGWLGSLFLVGVVVFALSGAVGAGIDAALSQDTKHLSTDTVQTLASLGQNLNYPMTCIGLALMYLAAGFLIRRTGLLPGWLSWVSWLFALLAASIVLGFVPLAGSALWMIVVGIYLAARPPVEG
ncbi:MAG: hypothetical protein JO337_11305 [Acidimicrobiales bacterium]|nr:hypothetical protein [Acidimicrobiales bacterium]